MNGNVDDDEVDLEGTIDFDDADDFLIVVDPDDADILPVSAAPPPPREHAVWVSNDESAGTVIVSPEEALDKMIAFLDGVRGQLVMRRFKTRQSDLVLTPQEREIYFDGLGLADDELARATDLLATSSGPEDLEALMNYLRDIQILRFQRGQLAIELDPATLRDDRGRPKPRLRDFGLNVSQCARLTRLFERAARLESVPNDALHLLLQKPAEFCVGVSSYLTSSMDVFRCYSAPYAVPDYGIPANLVLRNTGYEINVSRRDDDIFRSLPQSPHAPEAGARVIFFQMARDASPLDVAERYCKLGLRPLDFWELMAFNVANADFMKHKPNTTYWSVGGDLRIAACYTHEDGKGKPQVTVKRPKPGKPFIVGWNFAGVPIGR